MIRIHGFCYTLAIYAHREIGCRFSVKTGL